MLAPAEHDLDACVARIDAMKIFPVAAVRVIRVSQDPDAILSDMVQAVSNDPVLAGRVLQVANSPLVGLRAQVRTLERAVSVLGLMGTRDVTITALVGMVAPGVAPWGPMLHRDALLTAHLSKLLAQDVPSVDASEAFVTGLLHNLGHLLLLALEEEATVALLEKFHDDPAMLHRAEQTHFGFVNAALSAACVRTWELPESIAGTVENQSELPKPGEVSLAVVVLQAAKHVASATVEGTDPDHLVAAFESYPHAQLLNLPQWRIEALMTGVEDILAAL